MKSCFLLFFAMCIILLKCNTALAEKYFPEDSLIKNSNNSFLNKKAKRDYFSLGGGIIFNSTTNNHQFKNGYNITFNYVYIVSPTLGARIDLDFIHSDRKAYTYYSFGFGPDGTRYYQYYGGEAKSYLLTMKLLMGSLNPDDLAQFYFLPGIGVGVTNTTAQYDIYMKGSPTVYPFSDEAHKSLSLGISAGLGMNIKTYNNVRIFIESQFNYWYLASDAPTGFGAIKFGVML